MENIHSKIESQESKIDDPRVQHNVLQSNVYDEFMGTNNLCNRHITLKGSNRLGTQLFFDNRSCRKSSQSFAMAMCKDDFRALYNQALNEESARIVPIYAEMLELGTKYHMGYTRNLKPSQVGVHRKNRDGTMVNGREALAIWDDIDRTGVSPDLYKDATAFEEPPDRVNEKMFIRICRNDSNLRNYRPGEIEVSSVACSHWNQALASAEAGLVYIMHRLTQRPRFKHTTNMQTNPETQK